MDEVMALIDATDVEVLEEQVEHTDAVGLITSVYFRDPGGNPIEVSNYASRLAPPAGVRYRPHARGPARAAIVVDRGGGVRGVGP